MKFNLVDFSTLILAMVLSSPFSTAAEINGMKLPDQAKVEGKTLMLNGTGMRQVSFLHVNVYAGALYLQTPSHDAEQVAKSDLLKRMELTFARDVGAKDIAKAWGEGFEKNCETACEAMKPLVAKLQGMMSDMKKGDVMAYDFLPARTQVFIRGAQVGTIEGRDFSQNMIRCWIGKTPPNEELKKGLLGLKN
jgi:hypothetical protein